MPYSILTLDGGGTWALIEVRALIELYGASATGHDVLRRFDLVAANSGGSIVLAGQVENKALGDILLLFKDEANRRAIFSPTTSFGDQTLRALTGIGPKYSAAAKLPALERLLPQTGDRPLTQAAARIIGPNGAPVHLLIIGFDYDRNAATFFRSAPVGNGWGVGEPTQLSLAGAVHASTNAPLNYFDAPAELPASPDRFWDGGLTGNNNPALAACVEAVTLGHAPTDLRILSLGTGTVRLPLADPSAPASPYLARRQDSTLIRDLGKAASVILDDPPDFATFAVHALTGGKTGLPAWVVSRIVRASPLVSPISTGGTWGAPPGWTAAQFQYICALGMDAIAATDVAYIDDWCSLWIAGTARNQPIRMDGQTLATEIGYATFQEAMNAWRVLSANETGKAIS